ncbi:MAG: hypothetical protein LUQ65_10820 [Candidatus Helarchaeota archaeon]|nr:hypothetical protein [Candidatus Helarchaeota archaeon]
MVMLPYEKPILIDLQKNEALIGYGKDCPNGAGGDIPPGCTVGSPPGSSSSCFPSGSTPV